MSSRVYAGPDGQKIYLSEPRRPVDRQAAIEVWAGAVCAQVDPELFFPEKGESPDPARWICRGCPVQELCLDTFGEVIDHGVVGGLTAAERFRTGKRVA